MKIKKLSIPAGFKGLEAIELGGLGDVVLLAGPNGSGKSRILDAVQQFGKSRVDADRRLELKRQIRGQEVLVEHTKKKLSEIDCGISSRPNLASTFESRLSTAERNIASLLKQVEDGTRVELEPEALKPSVVRYRVTDLKLKDWKVCTHNEMALAIRRMGSAFSVSSIPEAAISAVRNVILEHILTEQLLRSDSEEQKSVAEAARERFHQLRQLILGILGAEITWDTAKQADPMIFGRPLGNAGLSDGQIVLLQIALSLFFQDGKKEELILLLDEPENHLHPRAVIDIITRIRSACPSAQIWIATHSVSILAHFDPSSIWYVTDGTAARAGRGAVEVLHSLLGSDVGVAKVARFLALPAKAALLDFATQCLLPPGVADTDTTDPQTNQVAEILSTLWGQGRALRVVDFGAGSGRLLNTLQSVSAANQFSLSEMIDYFAYDVKRSEHSDICESRISSLYGAGAGDRLLIGPTAIRKRLNPGTVDILILCNTLHEIPPEKWGEIFGPEGLITTLLSPQGFLLVVEDQQLSIGERAHDYGFLVLDSLELMSLFDSLPEDGRITTEDHKLQKYAGRLKAHLVPAALLARYSATTRFNAIRTLKQSASEKALAIRNNNDEKAGRAYAFWTQQHFNAETALKAFQ
jgi:predicted ATPase